MTQHAASEINFLIGEFMDLQERWEGGPDAFDWTPLQALAGKGALAYNEGAGPSFHALVLDGIQHGEFHERFFAYSLQAGFDPFKLAQAGSGSAELPVIDHAGLAEDALSNPSSARMRASLLELARTRFEPLVQEIQGGTSTFPPALLQVLEACVESIPDDLLQRVAPELVRPHRSEPKRQAIDPVEGYLSSAEMIVDSNAKPYG